MKRLAIAALLPTVLAGCSPNYSIPAHVYRHMGDRFRASLPFYGRTCGSALWSWQFRAGNADCYRWHAPRAYSGVWSIDDANFLPGVDRVVAWKDRPDGRIYLVTDDPKLWKILFTDRFATVRDRKTAPRDLMLRFVGRETDGWHQYDGKAKIVIVDRIITGRSLPPTAARPPA